MAVEPPLEASPVARHGEAADEEENRGEDVALLGQTQPGGILQRLIDRPEEVDETDDGYERGILEKIDDVVDDPGHDDAQGLRQGDEHLYLPPVETDGVGGFLLTDRDALQAAAHRLGHVGSVEQGECHHGADQAVDADAAGQEQRHHHRRHEEYREQGHAAPQLDEADRQVFYHRQLGAAAERQEDAERQRTGHRYEGDDDVEHQAAPQAGVDIGQSQYAADQEDARQDREHGQQQDDEKPAMADSFAHNGHAE